MRGSRRTAWTLGVLLLSVLVVSACGAGGGATVAEPVADFSLFDVNATSATAGLAVSPRDYLGQVSVWYIPAGT